MSSFYVGGTPSITELLGVGQPRYFYALRRTEDFTEFEYGVDFFDGRVEADHSRPYSNLQWDQYRWDNKNMFYYVNDQGELVVRINQEYAYDASQKVS